MKNEIIDIICEACQNDEIKSNENIDLLEEELIDSMAFISIISKIEKKFKIDIQPTTIPSYVWRNVNSIVDMVEKKIKERE